MFSLIGRIFADHEIQASWNRSGPATLQFSNHANMIPEHAAYYRQTLNAIVTVSRVIDLI